MKSKKARSQKLEFRIPSLPEKYSEPQRTQSFFTVVLTRNPKRKTRNTWVV
jgi:hypothetical protein